MFWFNIFSISFYATIIIIIIIVVVVVADAVISFASQQTKWIDTFGM